VVPPLLYLHPLICRSFALSLIARFVLFMKNNRNRPGGEHQPVRSQSLRLKRSGEKGVAGKPPQQLKSIKKRKESSVGLYCAPPEQRKILPKITESVDAEKRELGRRSSRKNVLVNTTQYSRFSRSVTIGSFIVWWTRQALYML